MTKKEKGRGRNVYFRDPKNWDKVEEFAKSKRWSINQVIEQLIETMKSE